MGHQVGAQRCTLRQTHTTTTRLSLQCCVSFICHTDKKVRDKTVKVLRLWLGKQADLTTLDMLKIWKGLFYCNCHVGGASGALYCNLQVSGCLISAQCSGS